MGSGKENTPTKSSKTVASTQETPTPPSYPDWSSSMQAYYGAGATPPPFFTSPVASPSPHPYVWGGQHLIPSYGTPLPYPAIYPHGGFYSHPNMATSQGAALTTTETDAKGPDGKDRVSMKKSKGSSGNIVGGKSGESGKAASGSGNDGASQSAESGSDDSSDASDENSNQQELAATKKKSFNQMLADGASAQNGNTTQHNGAAIESSFNARGQPSANLPGSVPGNPVGTMPPTNLNIGMDLWNSSPGAIPLRSRPNASSATMVGREGAVAEHLWVQDERELKKQKRKQSNRESARRSRLRKQAECEELQTKVETLSNENHNLNEELRRLSEECGKLTDENNSLMTELTQLYGKDAVSALLDGSKVNNSEGNGFGQETSTENNTDSG